MTIAPSRITQKRTKNSNPGPEGASIVSSGTTRSLLREDQRYVVLARAEPARDEPVDRPVRGEGADGGVDGLPVRRSFRENGGEVSLAVELSDDVQIGLVAGETESDRKIEQERVRAPRSEHLERLRPVFDDDRLAPRSDAVHDDRRQRR